MKEGRETTGRVKEREEESREDKGREGGKQGVCEQGYKRGM